jgi:hypothetical protein
MDYKIYVDTCNATTVVFSFALEIEVFLAESSVRASVSTTKLEVFFPFHMSCTNCVQNPKVEGCLIGLGMMYLEQ